MSECLLHDERFHGRCCCNCRNLAEDFSHPNTDGGSCTQRRGFVCMAPEFVEVRPAKMFTFPVRVVFSGWSEHGMCEMHDFRPLRAEAEESK